MPTGRSLRQVPSETVEQRVPAASMDRSHPAEVVIELAAREEVGERQLVDHRRAAVGDELRPGEWLDELARCE